MVYFEGGNIRWLRVSESAYIDAQPHTHTHTLGLHTHSQPRRDPDSDVALGFCHSAHYVCHLIAPLEKTQHILSDTDHCVTQLA